MLSLFTHSFKKIIFFSLVVVIAGGEDLKAQNYQPAVDFIKQFKNVQDQLPRESVYLHTDRDWYYFGERIWFSAYTVSGGYLLPSELSTVLYVELVAPDGTIAKREMVKMEAGNGNGSLTFEDVDEASGTYEIRAYTKWGLNFGESYAFTKKINVFTGTDDIEAETTNEEFDVQFFAESGHLVDGLSTSLAFKAITANGLGTSIEGTIYDNDDQAITDFSSSHLGMGAINFTPKAGQKYYAMVDGEKYSLPEGMEDGAILNIGHKNGFFTVNLQASESVENQAFLLFAHVRGTVYHAAPIAEAEKGVSAMIPQNNFPTGIVHFTLLNGQGEAVAERLAYAKNPVDQLDITASMNKSTFTARERVSLDLKVRDEKEGLVQGTASVSVFDDNIHAYQPNSGDITTHFQLGTEIKGHIEQPGFYFSDAPNADAYLDLLMQTQGWRAFAMDTEELKKQLENLTPPETGIEITGRITSLWGDKPLKDAAVFLAVGSDNSQSQIITTNEKGLFTAKDLEVQGREVVNVRANRDGGGDRLWIEMDEQFAEFADQRDPVIQSPFAPASDTAGQIEQEPVDLKQRSEAAIAGSDILEGAEMSGDLGEFTVTGEAETDSYTEQVFSEGELSGSGTQVNMDEADYLRDLPIEQILNQLPGVQYNSQSNSVTIRNSFSSISSGPLPPLIIVDGAETDFQFVSGINTQDIKNITVARSSLDLAIYGARGAGGAIIITTRSGAGLSSQNERGTRTTYVEGFQEPTNFYSPKYGINVPKDMAQLDNRITLHWEPEVNFSGENNTVEFWTSDVASQYRIVIEGITETGTPFYKTQTFVAGGSVGSNE